MPTATNSAQFCKSILPKKLRTSTMITTLVQASVPDAKKMVKDFERTTKTWKGARPKFQSEVRIEPQVNPVTGEFPKKIFTTVWSRADGSKGYWKWRWLDEGTKKRYALMQKGFRPKTHVGQLDSWKGAKGAVLVHGRPLLLKKPLPGIKARKFTKTLTKKWTKPYMATMKKAMAKAAKVSGHAK